MNSSSSLLNDDAILFSSLLKQRDSLASGSIKSVELTQKYIARIKMLNPALNIVIRENFEAAQKRSAELDLRLASVGKPVGPLHGVPFTIKDAFRVKNFKTSYGIPLVNCLPSFESCEVVERLISAGGVFLGQTNVPLFCFDWQTDSPIYGLTKNPLNPEHTVGGSSGGSAASVAAFFSPFEVGSDVAGSIRYPAHCCGVFGLRPTHDFVRFDDIGPSFHKKFFSNLAVAGPIARSIEDLQLVLEVLTGTKSAPRKKETLKVGYTFEWSGVSVDASSRKILDIFISETEELGFTCSKVNPTIDFDECTEIWGLILGYEYKNEIPPPFKFKPFINIFNHFFNTRRFQEGAFKDSFQKGLLASESTYLENLKLAEQLRNQFDEQFNEFDLWLTPVAVSAAIKHQKTGNAIMVESKKMSYSSCVGNFLIPTALFHHPVLVAPIGLSESGLPIGVQIHGKRNQDWQLLADSAFLVPGPRCGRSAPTSRTWNPS